MMAGNLVRYHDRNLDDNKVNTGEGLRFRVIS